MRPGPARRLLQRRPAATGVAALALGWALTFFVHPWSDESVGDLGTRSIYADLMLEGQVPYHDFGFEYPPLAAPAVALPGLVGTAEDHYRLGIAAFAFGLAVLTLVLVAALARRTAGAEWPAVLAVAATPLLLGAVVRLHFDLAAVVLTVAALLALAGARPALGLALVGLGGLTKGFPLVLAPVALAWLWGSGERRALGRGAAALVATVAVGFGGWVAYSHDGAHDTLSYQLDRPLQIESSPASVVLMLDALGGEQAMVVHSHATAGLEHPLDTALALSFGAALAIAVMTAAVLAAGGARRARRPVAPDEPTAGAGPGHVEPRSARTLVLAGLTAVAAFAGFGRVLSPQYLVWIVPLLALALAWRLRGLAVACATACALTLAEFPSRYLDLVAREPLAVGITAVRNAALLTAVALALVELRRSAGGIGRPPVAAGAGAGLSPPAAAAAPPRSPVRPAPLR